MRLIFLSLHADLNPCILSLFSKSAKLLKRLSMFARLIEQSLNCFGFSFLMFLAFLKPPLGSLFISNYFVQLRFKFISFSSF